MLSNKITAEAANTFRQKWEQPHCRPGPDVRCFPGGGSISEAEPRPGGLEVLYIVPRCCITGCSGLRWICGLGLANYREGADLGLNSAVVYWGLGRAARTRYALPWNCGPRYDSEQEEARPRRPEARSDVVMRLASSIHRTQAEVSDSGEQPTGTLAGAKGKSLLSTTSGSQATTASTPMVFIL